MKKGFTIIELLVYLGLLSVFLVILSQIITSILDARLEAQSVSGVVQDGIFINHRFGYDASRANAIVIPTYLGSSSATLVFSIDLTEYTYSLDGSNIILTVNGQSDRLNGSETNISNLIFTKVGNVGGKDTVRIGFTITSRAVRNGKYETKDYLTTVGLR